ncbi:MAG: hypothetical protein ACFFC7_03475, partial [Candidatus Hermodarchaeota archaeon]
PLSEQQRADFCGNCGESIYPKPTLKRTIFSLIPMAMLIGVPIIIGITLMVIGRVVTNYYLDQPTQIVFGLIYFLGILCIGGGILIFIGFILLLIVDKYKPDWL